MAKKDKKGKVKDEESGGGNAKWSDADDALLVATMTTQKADGLSRRPARSMYPRLTHKRRASCGYALGLSD